MLYIETAEHLQNSLHVVQNQSVLGLDIETTGLDAIQDRIRLIQIGTPDEVLVIDVFKVGLGPLQVLKPILEDDSIIKILHNAKFDVKFIKYHLAIDVERIFDSYLASLLLAGGLIPKGEDGKQVKGYHKLDNVVKRYTDLDISKDEQTSNWSGVLTKSQIEYAAKDVEILFPLREAMKIKLAEAKLNRCAKLEFETILPTAWLELSGFYLNFDQWLAVADEQKAQSYIVEAEILSELAYLVDQGSLFGECAINLNSPQQVQKYFRAHGIPMPDSTRGMYLAPLKEEYPLIGKFLDFKKKNKAYTAFGENYKEFVSPVTGRIHANYKQIGAGTGRYSTSYPNLSQIPADNEHRNCFQAEEGNVLVISDFSQEELRLLAEFSQDVKFRQAFKDGDDFHYATAALIFKIPLEQVDKDARGLAKRANFLVSYGGGAEKLSIMAGIPLHEAQAIIDIYFSTFKAVKRWLNYQKNQVLNTRQARTISGRIAKYDFDINNGKSRSHAQREAANVPMQGSGADILKRTMRLFYNKTKPYHPDIKLVNIVHDELIAECKKELAETTKQLLEESMKEAWYESIKHVDIKVDTHILPYWEKG